MNNTFQGLAVGLLFLLTYLAEYLFPQRKDLLKSNHDLKNIMVGLVNLLFSFVTGYYLQKLMQYTLARHFGSIPFNKIPTSYPWHFKSFVLIFSFIGGTGSITRYLYFGDSINSITRMKV